MGIFCGSITARIWKRPLFAASKNGIFWVKVARMWWILGRGLIWIHMVCSRMVIGFPDLVLIYLAWKGKKRIPWPRNKHYTDWGHDVSVADQRKTCVKTKALALSFTLLAIALGLGENPISGRKPVTSRFYKSKIYHQYTVHMSKTTNIVETS